MRYNKIYLLIVLLVVLAIFCFARGQEENKRVEPPVISSKTCVMHCTPKWTGPDS